jgi:hypothetical protein
MMPLDDRGLPLGGDDLGAWLEARKSKNAEREQRYRGTGPDMGDRYDVIEQAFDDKYKEGAYSVMSAIITGSWTAFEVLTCSTAARIMDAVSFRLVRDEVANADLARSNDNELSDGMRLDG